MVHALKEAWRVLSQWGLMIDMRPICLNAPVHILYAEKEEFAGVVDMSLDIDSEIAADRAIQEILSEGMYKEIGAERFEIAYYWDTVRGMLADLRNRWKDDATIDESVTKRAYEIFRKHRGHKRVRLQLQMKLSKYEKQNTAYG
jgi:hypothetical protein